MSVEPMMMGSPMSPASPGAHTIQSPYLPSYLMGDPTPSSSPANRLWSGTPTTSPPKGSTSFSKNITSPTAHNPPMFGQTPRIDPRQRDVLPGRTKEKAGAPPVQGLLEAINSPATHLSESRHQEYGTPIGNFSQFGTPGGAAYTPGFCTPSAGHTTIQDTSHIFNQSVSKKTPPSPAQVDPFYTQGEQIRSGDQLDETWITVFGFPPAATSFILQQFSQYGNICKHVVASDGNWMHIHYQSKLQAKKALSKNGKIFGNSIMVGVTPCIDKEIMATQSNPDDSQLQKSTMVCTPGAHGTPGVLNHSVLADRSLNISRNTSIRPLTAAYKAASTDHQVVQAGSTPQKNNGVVSKAMEYMFGW